MMRRWRSYRHRFVPWLALNWKTRSVKQTNRLSDLVKEEAGLAQLNTLLSSLAHTTPPLPVRDVQWLLKSPSTLIPLADKAAKEMLKVFGFRLELRDSNIPGGGRGVFLSEDSCTIPPGKLVALYPGTVYLPSEPVLLQSLGNPFLFRCADGWMIDGHSRGLSNWIYKSCAYRDVIGPHMSCDLTWLLHTPLNPLSIGQMVNNHSPSFRQNVEYVEVSLPQGFPLQLRQFLPNVFYSSWTADARMPLRLVALMSTKTIVPAQELFSSYLTVVTDQ
ncbi:SET domain-containing protein 9-like [Halichondria panicea]|uniref:SET domain-containing protein 9-like n=1 Tax=Halichondria panicea TaxID=6063 RepID=UPI00312B448D